MPWLSPGRTRRPRTLVGVTGAAVLAVAVVVAGQGAASAAMVPATPATPAGVVLPVTVDNSAAYQGQTICTSVVPTGTQRLKDLLLQTYGTIPGFGSSSVQILRNCSSGGQSEHKEGRALDWMVDVTKPDQKAVAESFLSWLLGPDASGVPAGNARRLGVMYIGWDNLMWRSYDPTRGAATVAGTTGWDPLVKGGKACTSAARATAAWATDCHRNHVHLSLSWDGASGLTSFWSGQAVTAPSCPAGPAASRAAAGSLLDTTTGEGTLAATPCRVAQQAPLKVLVAQPGPAPAGQVWGLTVRVDGFTPNAPATLTLSSALSGSAVVGRPGTTVTVPLGPDGMLTAAVDAGDAWLRLTGMGLTPVAPPAGGAGLSALSTRAITATGPEAVRTGGKIKLAGSAIGGKKVTVRRYLKAGGAWRPAGAAIKPTGGSWAMTTTAPSPRTMVYRVALLHRNGKVLAWSNEVTVRVVRKGAPLLTLVAPATVSTGAAISLSGKAKALPSGATVSRQRLIGRSWTPLGTTVPAGGRWSMQVIAPSPQTITYRAVATVGGAVVAASSKRVVTVS